MIDLLPFQEQHLNATFVWMQSESLRKMFFLRREITREQHMLWFNGYTADETQRIYAIHAGGNYVGNLGLKHIGIDKNAETWIYLGPENLRGNGIARKAYEKLFEHPEFLQLKIRKLYCHIADFNTASIVLYTKLDFALEGIFKDEVEIEGNYYSLFRMGRIL